MKKAALILVFIRYAFVFMADAQVDHGGFGNFFIGPYYNISTPLQNDLSSDNLLGNNLELNSVALSYGGAGYSVRSSGLVIGGSGYSYQLTSRTPKSEVFLRTGCGFFNAGYCFLNKNNWLGFPYFGLGGFGSGFKITNTSTDKIFIIDVDTITYNETVKYSTAGLAFDLGFALKYFTINKEKVKNGKSTGAEVGIDAGASFFPSIEKWHNSETNDEITSLSTPFSMAIYIRLTLGLGVFVGE